MPKQVQKAEVNTFVGGLITEANPLNFPPNASADELNFELNRDGSRNRRLGMNFEPSFGFQNTGYTVDQVNNLGTNTFAWNAVAGNPTLNYIVFQVGQRLLIYNANVTNFSGTGYITTLLITQFSASTVYSMASVEGKLVVVSGAETIAVVQLIGNSLVVTYERLVTRDLWGVEETEIPAYENDVSFRAGAFSNLHAYNLQNQSWGIPRKDQSGTLGDPQLYYGVQLGVYPSNSEQVWAGLQFQAVAIGQDPFERMFGNLWQETLGSKSVAAKGYYTIDVLRRGQSRFDAMVANNAKYPQVALSAAFRDDFSPFGPVAVEEFSGRVFYGGFQGQVTNGDARSPTLGNYVFFSQLVKSAGDITKCYQEGDPTSRDDSDIVDTDGGFIRISGAQQILAMHTLGLSLIVYASNGVWSITGGETDSGFSATNYKVSQISNFGIVSQKSVVIEGSSAYFWANDGIYEVAPNQLGDFSVSSITLKTIQSLYRQIPNLSKEASFGAYDEVNKKIRWVYTINDIFSFSQETYELIFDTALNAFTQNQIMNSVSAATVLTGMFTTQNATVADVSVDVAVNDDLVLSNVDGVVLQSSTKSSAIQFVRYFAFSKQGTSLFTTVAYYWDQNWEDWVSQDGVGVDAKAHCLTGDVTAGDSSINKQIPYLTMSFVRTENGADTNGVPLQQSSCLMRTQWNFANAIQSNKWSALQQAYRYRKVNYQGVGSFFDTGFSVIQSKNKVRGRGRAFALYFETEPGKDCQILGWNIAITGDTQT